MTEAMVHLSGEEKEAVLFLWWRTYGWELEGLNKERTEVGEKPFRGFAKYFHWLELLRLVEPTDRWEPAIYDFLEERVFYRLTDKGKAEVEAWQDLMRGGAL